MYLYLPFTVQDNFMFFFSVLCSCNDVPCSSYYIALNDMTISHVYWKLCSIMQVTHRNLLEGWRKTTVNVSEASQSLDSDFYSGPPEWEGAM